MIWHMAGLPDIPSPRDRSEQPARVQVLTPGSGLLFVRHCPTPRSIART